jgi:hypothetical protein
MSATREPKGLLPITPENYPERIPDFATEEEARDFWDTHSSEPYFDQGEDVTNNPPPELLQGRGRDSAPNSTWPIKPKVSVALSFPEEMMAAFSAFAARREIPVEVLLQWWIADRLDQEQGAERVQPEEPETRSLAPAS